MQSDEIAVVLGGDTGLIAPAYRMAKTEPKYASFLNLLETADIVFVNLETALTDHEYPDSTSGANKGDPILVKDYASMGIDIMSIGHKVFDFGNVGLIDSIKALDEAGIKRVGAGKNPAEATREEVIEVKGQRIGFMKIGVHPPSFRRYEALIVNDAHQKPVLEKPGLALLYLKTIYEIDPDQGSITPRTSVIEEVLQKFIRRIKGVRKKVDL
ncbi:MAG: CapA family protein, partial [Candidatus Bathyarchaeia archaeon]